MIKRLGKKGIILLFTALSILAIGGVSMFLILYFHTNNSSQNNNSISISINAKNIDLLLGDITPLEISTNVDNCKLTFIIQDNSIVEINGTNILAKKCGQTTMTILASKDSSFGSKTISIHVWQSYEIAIETFENCYIKNDTLYYTDNAQFSFLLKNNVGELIPIDNYEIQSDSIKCTIDFATIFLNDDKDGILTFIFKDVNYICHIKLVYYKNII